LKEEEDANRLVDSEVGIKLGFRETPKPLPALFLPAIAGLSTTGDSDTGGVGGIEDPTAVAVTGL
jgi:hypothetical protein